MTKKSQARLARDRARKQAREHLKKNNRCWDELNNIYQSAKTMLYQHIVISTLAANKELMARLKDPNSTINNIKILGNDIRELNVKLEEIHQLHANRYGGSDNPDEVMYSINISQKYAELMETHNSVVQPTALKILEDLNQAEIQYYKDTGVVPEDVIKQMEEADIKEQEQKALDEARAQEIIDQMQAEQPNTEQPVEILDPNEFVPEYTQDPKPDESPAPDAVLVMVGDDVVEQENTNE